MMKKSLLYSAAVLATWSMTSCSNEVLDDGLNHEAGQVIELAVENAGSGIANRAGRPLLSSEADQNIDKVYVFVVENTTTQGENGKQNISSKVLAIASKEEWNSSSNTSVKPYNDASGHGRKARFEVKTADFTPAENSSYVIYAVGYSSDTNLKVENEKLEDYLNSIKVEDTDKKFENLVLSNGDGTLVTADEFFAGKANITFTKGTNKFSQGITLHRQVAGIFTYVKNVPYMLDKTGEVCKTLQLVASKPNKKIVLGSFYDKILGYNNSITIKDENQKEEVELTNKLKNVVNGTEAFDKKQVVSTINLNSWFNTLQDENNDGLLDRYDYVLVDDEEGGNKLVEDTNAPIWTNPLRKAKNNTAAATFVKGSVFSGEFIIPFQKVDQEQTFALELLGTDGEVVRTWNINLPSKDLVKGATLNIWNNNGWTPSEATYADNANYYSVLRNHLYGVGTKTAANPSPKPNPNPGPGETDPEPVPDPEDPTPDVEDPQDLNTKQDILLQVNDNWEVIHTMEVE